MIASDTALNGLERQRPEWAPWLAVVREIVRETGSADLSVVASSAKAEARRTKAEWDAAVPSLGVQRPMVPLLAAATVTLRSRSVRRLLERLIGVASRAGTAEMASLASMLNGDEDVIELFGASIRQDADYIDEIAAARRVDAAALQAVTALLPLPFLHAYHRRWSTAISESWVEGYCPLCGAWPAFAEVRGIERNRCFRCSRCGVAWHARLLHCPYCSLHDHEELVSLVPEKDASRGAIEACKRCLGYVKTFTRLQGCAPETVMLEDMGSVDLDIAALEQGYSRPPGPGYRLEITVSDDAAPRRWFARER